MEDVSLKREREEFNKAEQAADAARHRLLDLVQSRVEIKEQMEIILAVFDLYRAAGLEGVARMSLRLAESQEWQKELGNARR